jgi:hypothetical protein
VPNRDPVHGNGSSMIPFEVIRHLPDDVEVTLLTYRSRIAVPPRSVDGARTSSSSSPGGRRAPP